MGVLGDLASRVLVVNTGSSSLKFKLFNMNPLTPVLGGVIERIGDVAKSSVAAKVGSEKLSFNTPVADHKVGMQVLLDLLTSKVSKNVDKEVKAVGHRIVHGLTINKPVSLTDTVLSEIRKAATLAPLHNPPGLAGVEAAQQVFDGVLQVGVFDTAFHQTMPPHAYMYPIPYDLYEKEKIRRYGFHGTSYNYLVKETAAMLNKPVDQVNMIACHLGNGSSMCAIQGGKCIDTTMGMTPLEGLMMGTRSGDIDPAIALHLINRCGFAAPDVDTLLNKRSGLLGITGNNDLRHTIAGRASGDPRAILAMDMFVYRVRKYVGAYLAALNGNADAIVFSAGIGENSALIRSLICKNFEAFGIEVDEERNNVMVGGEQGDISRNSGSVRVLVVPTDEEISIAQQTVEVLNGKQ